MTSVPTIERINEHSLTNADEAAIATLLKRCFTTDFGGRSFFQTRHSWRHVIRQDARMVAHLAVQLRAVRLGDQLLTVAGIADVATDPDFRGRGFAAALVQSALTDARRSPASHALLFGTAALYPAAGFRPARNPMLYINLTGARTGELRRSENAKYLQVYDLADIAWDETQVLDLLGGLF
ncbi:GNAT family N-acetyltransferase [Tabrizicola sp.]|uniref:GNAT family N-acetyltransferase n=1 Tax=Tabrizicola sp. TaxID=2005166 RepID=UPI003F37EDDA